MSKPSTPPRSNTAGPHADTAPAVWFPIEIEGQLMEVAYRRALFGGPYDHFEFFSPHMPPRRIPVSESGYRSHYASSSVVAEYGHYEVYAYQAALALSGIEPHRSGAQGGLFS